jgi:hypothetical protein
MTTPVTAARPMRHLFLFGVACVLVCDVVSGLAAVPQSARRVIAGSVRDASTAEPIAGATVTISGPGWSPARSGQTDVAGRFAITTTATGFVSVRASKAGFTMAAYQQRSPTGKMQVLDLGSRDASNSIVLRLWRHAVMSGVVRDESGEPLVGVPVIALQDAWIVATRRFVPVLSRRVVTDDRGEYRMTDLHSGEYVIAVPGPDVQLRAQAPATADEPYPTVYYPAAATAAEALRVSLRAGEVRSGVDLTVPVVPLLPGR